MLPLITHYLFIVPDQNGNQSFPEILVGNFPFCQNRLMWLKDVRFDEHAQSLRKRFCADIFHARRLYGDPGLKIVSNCGCQEVTCKNKSNGVRFRVQNNSRPSANFRAITYIQQIKELHSLWEIGAITKEHYMKQRDILLEQMDKLNYDDTVKVLRTQICFRNVSVHACSYMDQYSMLVCMYNCMYKIIHSI